MKTEVTNRITELLANFDDLDCQITVWHDDHIFYCDIYNGPQVRTVNVCKRHEDSQKWFPVHAMEFKRLLNMLSRMEKVIEVTKTELTVTKDIKKGLSWPTERDIEADSWYDAFTALGSGVGIATYSSSNGNQESVTCFSTTGAAVQWKLMARR